MILPNPDSNPIDYWRERLEQNQQQVRGGDVYRTKELIELAGRMEAELTDQDMVPAKAFAKVVQELLSICGATRQGVTPMSDLILATMVELADTGQAAVVPLVRPEPALPEQLNTQTA